MPRTFMLPRVLSHMVRKPGRPMPTTSTLPESSASVIAVGVPMPGIARRHLAEAGALGLRLEHLLVLHDVELQVAEPELAREAHLVGFGVCGAAEREQQQAGRQGCRQSFFIAVDLVQTQAQLKCSSAMTRE